MDDTDGCIVPDGVGCIVAESLVVADGSSFASTGQKATAISPFTGQKDTGSEVGVGKGCPGIPNRKPATAWLDNMLLAEAW